MGESYAYCRSLATYLDHDHRERENIRFLAGIPSFYDFWCGPSRSVTPLVRRVSYGMRVLSDNSDAKIRQPCMRGTFNNVHKNIHLVGRKWSCETKFRIITYSLEISVDHIARMEIIEALRNLGQLVTRMSAAGAIFTRGTLTSLNPFAPGYFFKYSDRSPAAIKGETSCGGETLVPRRGKTFSCFRYFHITASSQNICPIR